MKMKRMAFAATVLLALGLPWAGAQNIVGYDVVTVPAGADMLVSVPFTQPPDIANAVSVVSANPGAKTVTAAANTFQGKDYSNGLYYVRFTSGAADGLWGTVTANSTDTLTLESDILTGVAANDTFVVYPHQTLGSVFPPGQVNRSMLASDMTFPVIVDEARTQVFFIDPTAVGPNKTPNESYLFHSGNWRKVGDLTTVSYDNKILRPGEYFIVRNAGTHPVTGQAVPLTFVARGQAPAGTLAKKLQAGTVNDYLVSTGRPVDITLSQLSLGGTAAFEDSTMIDGTPVVTDTGDELFIIENLGNQPNPTPNLTFIYYDGAWRQVGDVSTVSYDSYKIKAGTGFVIRKSTKGSGTKTWKMPAPF